MVTQALTEPTVIHVYYCKEGRNSEPGFLGTRDQALRKGLDPTDPTLTKHCPICLTTKINLNQGWGECTICHLKLRDI